jgi:hypothetical protein
MTYNGMSWNKLLDVWSFCQSSLTLLLKIGTPWRWALFWNQFSIQQTQQSINVNRRDSKKCSTTIKIRIFTDIVIYIKQIYNWIRLFMLSNMLMQHWWLISSCIIWWLIVQSCLWIVNVDYVISAFISVCTLQRAADISRNCPCPLDYDCLITFIFCLSFLPDTLLVWLSCCL